MKKISLKTGFIIFGIALILFIAECFFITLLDFAFTSMSVNIGSCIFSILYFIYILTATVGILAPICGILNGILNKILNKKSGINIGWKLFSALTLILSVILFLLLGGLGMVLCWWRKLYW